MIESCARDENAGTGLGLQPVDGKSEGIPFVKQSLTISSPHVLDAIDKEAALEDNLCETACIGETDVSDRSHTCEHGCRSGLDNSENLVRSSRVE